MAALSPSSVSSPPLFTNDVKLTVEDDLFRRTVRTLRPDSTPGGGFPKVFTFTFGESLVTRLADCQRCRWRTIRWVIRAGGSNVANGSLTGSGPLPCRNCSGGTGGPGPGDDEEEEGGGGEGGTGRAGPGEGGPSDPLPPPPEPPTNPPCLPSPAPFPAAPPVPTPCT